MRAVSFALAAAGFAFQVPCEAGALRKNPIRNVVTMLQSMQKKVEAEGVKEKELYDKFMCYCKHGKGDLSSSITVAEDTMSQTSSNIKASEGKLAQSKENLKTAQADRSAAKDAMAEATALREKEAAAFAAYKADADTNIAAITKAVASLEKGMAGGFLQTDSARVVLKLAQSNQDLLDEADRQELLSFLSGSQSEGYAPQSGEITGLLKQMGETMAKDLADATATEEAAIKTYEGLVAAKKKEVAALSATVEAKTAQIGTLGVAIVQMQGDLSDTAAAQAADKEFLEGLEKSCSTKTAEWEERSKTRADELVALADTIRVLNDDDALDLFKRTLPGASASLVQMTATTSAVRARALQAVRSAQRAALPNDRSGLNLLMLTLVGKKSMSQGGFDKVIKMIDEMVEILKKEQLDDDHKKEYCGAQLDTADDKRKDLERTVSQEETAIVQAKEAIATLAEEIAALEAGVKALDKSVAEATEQRKEENAEYKELMTSNSAAKEVLGWAKNRLNKFYNPKMYVAPPKQELTEGERIFVSNGGTPPPTPPPGGIAGTGITALLQVAAGKARSRGAPAPPPETWGAYATKSGETGGVIEMINLLIKDLDKELTEAETEEKEAQADYETMMKESASKRAADASLLTEKSGVKADVEGALEAHNENKGSAVKEHMAVMKYIASLHSECDWLLQYFDVRKEARAGEADSLLKAKAVLSGADYALVQTKAHNFLARAA
eukprot:CAMPEP_0115696558 /NCGR_PEP_ID=MMETSP0272-20121206/65338_1 /TAXON_ID=71861 /ORGANISM="Scrippsiella trochoidea, Strain CCMP3099" /LENGTH=727 /DNA_ID=CAMNT_0003136781 /DNA_START=93 /DNA_END=2276 /DNA_ORIENTATION=+